MNNRLNNCDFWSIIISILITCMTIHIYLQIMNNEIIKIHQDIQELKKGK